ncbi:MAG TPA: cell division protein FtsA [Lentisphaeria bacterium]|nr:MAG: cell division protein FtsA [Lentisphaerae bacterium GWF2_49_21]HBC85498.1 cell division protein FtsA [Lentisphaeria bacterium]
MFKNRHIITAVEIATSKICVLIGEGNQQGHLSVLSHGEAAVESGAVCKGEIIDMDRVTKSLDEAIEKAEYSADTEIDSSNLYIAVTGSHIRSMRGSGHVIVTGEGRRVAPEHMVEALRNATMVGIPPECVILNSIDGNFVIDGLRRIADPEGQIADKLEAFAHIIYGNRNCIENFQAPLRELGYDTSIPVFSLIATASGVLTDDELKNGVLLIDIGAGTTEYMLFHDSGAHASGILAVGCDHIANDLSVGLDINNISLFRKMLVNNTFHSKKEHGTAFIEIEGNIGTRKIPAVTIEKIIDLRVREIFNLILSQLQSTRMLPFIDRGIVLTGGGALLSQVRDIASAVFETPVRVGNPIELSGAVTNLKSPRYGMVFGLLKHGERDRQIRYSGSAGPSGQMIKHIDRKLISASRETMRWIKNAIKF